VTLARFTVPLRFFPVSAFSSVRNLVLSFGLVSGSGLAQDGWLSCCLIFGFSNEGFYTSLVHVLVSRTAGDHPPLFDHLVSCLTVLITLLRLSVFSPRRAKDSFCTSLPKTQEGLLHRKPASCDSGISLLSPDLDPPFCADRFCTEFYPLGSPPTILFFPRPVKAMGCPGKPFVHSNGCVVHLSVSLSFIPLSLSE